MGKITLRVKYQKIDGVLFPADAYLLKYIFHNYDDDKCGEISSSIRQASGNQKGSPTTIFIVENVILPEGVISNWQSHELDMAMVAVLDNARERTEDEYKELLQKTDFKFTKLYPIQAPESVIEAEFVQ